FYAVLFCTLPLIGWRGRWVVLLVLVIVIEIILTLWDFVVEIAVRKPLGDVYAGERVAHAFMGIVYGSMIACLIPVIWQWWSMPTALVRERYDVPAALIGLLVLMGIGVFLSGVRDLYAALELPYGNWPWPKSHRAS